MKNKLKLCLFICTLMVAGISLSSCDFGIYDFSDNGNMPNLDIKDFLNPKTCYEQVLKDLQFMEEECLQDQLLANSQSFTILISYGMADMSKDASSYNSEQIITKAKLFESIKLINVYSNNAIGYSPSMMIYYTQTAISYCKNMLAYFGLE